MLLRPYRPRERTLLVPVDPQRLPLDPTIAIAGATLVRKVELHLTVLDSSIGRAVDEAIARDPALGRSFDALVDAADFSWSMPARPATWHLVREDLQTVIVEVDAPGVAAFFAACATQLGPLAAWQAPPTHVTLFTSDPHGKAGIGLRTRAELDRAIARARANDSTGLRAFGIAAVTR